jgi:agmatinase
VNKQEFNISGVGVKNNNIFGLPSDYVQSKIIINPAPWEVTASYRTGTSNAPQNILDSSVQIDLYHEEFPELWKIGISMLPIQKNILNQNKILCNYSQDIIKTLEQGHSTNTFSLQSKLDKVNSGCQNFIASLKNQTLDYLKQGKIVVTLGGDHSVSEGAISGHSLHFPSFGVLQFDAHMDLRKDYQGFIHSHASVMHNILDHPQITNLTQVGVRDYSHEEESLAKTNKKINIFSNNWIKKQLFNGISWTEICKKIISSLPENIYISFDIDVLIPSLCPSTGTPVPGGLGFDEIFHLISLLVASKKTIIGFDLVEVSGNADSIDAIIGTRALYNLCGFTVLSQGISLSNSI